MNSPETQERLWREYVMRTGRIEEAAACGVRLPSSILQRVARYRRIHLVLPRLPGLSAVRGFPLAS